MCYKFLQKNGQVSPTLSEKEPPPELNGQAEQLEVHEEEEEEELISIDVGQGEPSSVVQKEEASENMEVVKQELPTEDTKEEKDKNGLDSIAQAPSEEQSEQQSSKEPQSNELGFKKVFKFVGLKFTVKKEKSEKPDAVQLLTVKKDDVECNGTEITEEAKSGTPEEVKADTPEEIKLATPEEAELGSPAEVLEEELPVEQTEEVIKTEVPLEKAEESTTEQESPVIDKGEKDSDKPGESVKSPDISETSSPFKKFTSALFSGLRKRTSFKKSKEEQPAETSGKEVEQEEKEHASVPPEGGQVEVAESQEPSVEEPFLLETVENAEGYEVVMKEKISEEKTVETVELRESDNEIGEKMETIQSVSCEEKVENLILQAEQVIAPDADQTPSLQEVDKQIELIQESTEEVQIKSETQLTESVTEATPSAKPAEGVSSEVEQLTLQEKNKVQGSPLKKLFTGPGLKKLSGKRHKGKKEEIKTEDHNGQLQPSTEPLETAEPQKESSPSSEEETVVSPQEQTVVDAVQSDDAEGDGALSDGEKKKEGITSWASFKKMVTPKKRVKRPSESDKEDELTDKAKSATVSSTESAASSEKQEEVKGDGKEQKVEKNNEEPKKKVDSSVSWEALICVGSSKRRARKSSDSDDEIQKPVEETEKPVDEPGKPTEEESPATSQETDQEQGSQSPDNAGSPSDGEGVSTWESFKRLVTPRRKSKTRTEDKLEEPAAITADTVTSDNELGKEESWVSFKKLIPGRKKKKSDGKQEQAHTEEHGKDSAEAVEDDSETPAVVPLSEYDAAEQEKAELLELAVVAKEASEVKTELKEVEDALLSPAIAECSVAKLHSVTVEVENSNTDAAERSPSWISVRKETVDLGLECGDKKKTELVSETTEVIQEMHAAAVGVKKVSATAAAAAEVVELTSEAVTALEDTAEKSVAEETTEMISAVSQLSESAATSGEATPVPEAEEETHHMQKLSKQAQEVLQSVAEKVQLTEVSSALDSMVNKEAFESVHKTEVETCVSHTKTIISTVHEHMHVEETSMKGIPETWSTHLDEGNAEQTTEMIKEEIIVAKETIKEVRTEVLATMHTKLEDLQDIYTEKVYDTEVKEHASSVELQEEKVHELESGSVTDEADKQSEGTRFKQTEGLAEEPKADTIATEMVAKSEEMVLPEEFSLTGEVLQKVKPEITEVLQGGPLQYKSVAVEVAREMELVACKDVVVEQLMEKENVRVNIEAAGVEENVVMKRDVEVDKMEEFSEPDSALSQSEVVSDEMCRKDFGDEGMEDVSKSDADEMLKYEEQTCELTVVPETHLEAVLPPVTEIPVVESSEATEASVPITTAAVEEQIIAETVKVIESRADMFAVAEVPLTECSTVAEKQIKSTSYEVVSSEAIACPASSDECADTGEILGSSVAQSTSEVMAVTRAQSEHIAVSEDVTEPAIIVECITMTEAPLESPSMIDSQVEPDDVTPLSAGITVLVEYSLSDSHAQPAVISEVASENDSISEASCEPPPISEGLTTAAFTQVLTEPESLDEQTTNFQIPAETSAITMHAAEMADVLDSAAELVVASEVLPETLPTAEFLADSCTIPEVAEKVLETVEAPTKIIRERQTSAEATVEAEAVAEPVAVTDLAVTEAKAEQSLAMQAAAGPILATVSTSELCVGETLIDSPFATETVNQTVTIPEVQTKMSDSETLATSEEVEAGQIASVSDMVSADNNEETEIQSVAQAAAAIVDAAIEAATSSLSDRIVEDGVVNGSEVKEYEAKSEAVVVTKETSGLVQPSLEMQMQEIILKQTVVREVHTSTLVEAAVNTDEMEETESVRCVPFDGHVTSQETQMSRSVTLETKIMQVVQEHTDGYAGQNAVKDEQIWLAEQIAEYVPQGEIVAAEMHTVSETSREQSCEESVQEIRDASQKVTLVQTIVQPQLSAEPLQESSNVLHGTNEGVRSDPEQEENDPSKKSEAKISDEMVSLDQSAQQDGEQINTANAIAVEIEGRLLKELGKTGSEQSAECRTVDGQMLVEVHELPKEVNTEGSEYSQKQVTTDETLQLTSEQAAS